MAQFYPNYLHGFYPWPGPLNPDPPGPYSSETRIPFLAWNKTEGRPRTQQLDDSTKSVTYDPLWLLARQWQFGEWKGEDVGSAIIAKIAYKQVLPSHIKTSPEADNFERFDVQADCIFNKIQRIRPVLSLQQKAHLGLYLLKLMRNDALDSNIPSVLALLKFEKPVAPTAENWHQQMGATRFHANTALVRLTTSFSEKIPDGLLAYKKISENYAPLAILLNATVMESYLSFVEELYPELKNTGVPENWKLPTLSSELEVAYPEMNGDTVQYRVFGQRNLQGSEMNWYGLDYKGIRTTIGNEGLSLPEVEDYQVHTVSSVIPSAARFFGMPERRWWTMEDSQVNLGDVDSDLSEVLKRILSEFALVYCNDWLILPVRRKEMTNVTVEGILVKDVFGEYTLVKNAINSNEEGVVDPFEWGMFQHEKEMTASSLADETAERGSLESSVLFSSQRSIRLGDIREQVEFVRDEVNNMAWAIEKIAEDGVRGGSSANVIINAVRNHIMSIDPQISTESSDVMKFKLIADHFSVGGYIPFIPRKFSDLAIQDRSIYMQRSWLPNFWNGKMIRTRPVVNVLRKGLGTDDEIVSAEKQILFEETLLKKGMRVSDRYAYIRDRNGIVRLWLDRSVSQGNVLPTPAIAFDRLTRE